MSVVTLVGVTPGFGSLDTCDSSVMGSVDYGYKRYAGGGWGLLPRSGLRTARTGPEMTYIFLPRTDQRMNT
jgi:hypothetical protein